MKNADAITILRAAGMSDAVAVLEKVTAFQKEQNGLLPPPQYRSVLVYRHNGSLISVQDVCSGHHDDAESAIRCAERELPLLAATAVAQKIADPRVEMSFCVIRLIPEVVKLFDLMEKKA